MRYKIEFGFGVGEDKNGFSLNSSRVVAGLGNIRKEAARLFGGYTLRSVTGGWVNPEGRLVEEPGYTLQVFDDGSTNGNRAAMVGVIKEQLNQAAVAVTITEVKFSIV